MYESDIEQIALDVLRDDNGYTIRYGPDLAEGPAKERDYGDVILTTRLRAAIDRINPTMPAAAREEAYKRVLRADALTLLDNNEAFHRLLTDGIDVKDDEIRSRSATNLVQSRKFSEMLAAAVRRYQNGLIDSAHVIEELIKMAQKMREADKRGERMNLRQDELAFYDALADSE